MKTETAKPVYDLDGNLRKDWNRCDCGNPKHETYKTCRGCENTTEFDENESYWEDCDD